MAVIHNAVKPYMESIKPDAYLKKLKEDGYIIVGNIGRLSEQKGMEYFIDSYKKVHESIDKLKYVVVGQGEDEQSLKRKVEEEYNQDNIVFLGYRSDIQNIIAQMGFVAIIYSSITAGVGNSMIVYDTEKNYHDYRIFTFLACWITAFCVSCFSGLFQPFMKLWMGKDLLLPYPLVILLCVYFWVYEYIMMASVYKDAGGIWHEDRFRPLLSGITNLGLNLLIVKFLGLYGIVLSTIVSIDICLIIIFINLRRMIFFREVTNYGN